MSEVKNRDKKQSLALRYRALGVSVAEIAKKIGVSESTIRRWTRNPWTEITIPARDVITTDHIVVGKDNYMIGAVTNSRYGPSYVDMTLVNVTTDLERFAMVVTARKGEPLTVMRETWRVISGSARRSAT